MTLNDIERNFKNAMMAFIFHVRILDKGRYDDDGMCSVFNVFNFKCQFVANRHT